MAQRMGVVVAGEGAIARQHMAALRRMDDVDVVGIAGGEATGTANFAAEFGIPRHGLDLGEMLEQPGVDAAILTSPTPIHQWVHRRIAGGELTLQHLVASTLFFRRENKNALGQPRSWTDHLLSHHACHTVDLFLHQTGEIPAKAWAQQGPPHPELGIAMDLTVGLQAPSGALCTLALSFNNDGPFGTTFRYIGDTGTYIARYDDLVDGYDKPIDTSDVGASTNGVENQDREFVAAVREGREPAASVAQCLPAMQTLDRLEQGL